MPTTKRSKAAPTRKASAHPDSPKSTLPGKAHPRTKPRCIVAGDLYCMVGVSDPQITPDGRNLIVVRKVTGERNRSESSLWRVGTDGSEAPHPLTTGTRDSHPRVSPEGTTVAFVRGMEGKPSQIALIALDGGEARIITRFPEGTLRLLSWSPKGTHLAVAFRPTEPERTEAARKERERTGASEPPRVLETRWYRLDGDGWFGAERFAIYLVDVRTGRAQVIYDEDDMGMADLAWSPDGERVAITTNRSPESLWKPWKAEILIYDLASESLTAIPGLPIGPKSAIAWSPDGRRLAWAGRTGRDGAYSTENLELWTCAAPSKVTRGSKAPAAKQVPHGEPRSLTHTFDICLASSTLSDCADAAFDATIRWAPNSESIYVRIGQHGSGHLVAIDLAGNAPRFLHHEKAEYSFGSLSADGSLIAATRSDPLSLPEAGVMRLTKKGAIWQALSRFNRALLNELVLAEPTEHWVEAEDGARTHVWLLEPPEGAPKRGHGKKRPAILQIHGGPHTQYGNVFFHEFQLLAAQGYTVVYSNPRGSKGYGRDHCAAIRGSWGDRDWADIQAVTRWMQHHPRIDATRLGVMGGSYGGYMTNWAIAHTKAFKAAITDRCVSNMLSMAGNSDYLLVPDEYWAGAPYDRPERLWQASPIAHFKGVSTPTLIIHSEGDLRCNIEQADQVHTALSLQGVPCRYVRYPASTSHGMSRSGPADLRVHRLDEIVAWWSRWL